MSIRVSVIIPVYNAKQYIRQAVESALIQPETAEVILIDDGSFDGSREICEKLAADDRVLLLTHPENVNKGAAASRNLGMSHAMMPFIAFLDADDTFVPDRFSITGKVFGQYPDADGVHEVIGSHYYREELREIHKRHTVAERTGIRTKVLPERLFRTLAQGRYGHISPIGLTLKRSSVDSANAFDTTLELSEDSEYILRLSVTSKIYQGDPDRIVSLRGVHGQNTAFTNPRVMQFRRIYLQKCVDHNFYGSRDLIAAMYIISRRVGASGWFQPFRKLGKFALPFKLAGIALYLLVRPGVVLNLLRMATK